MHISEAQIGEVGSRVLSKVSLTVIDDPLCNVIKQCQTLLKLLYFVSSIYARIKKNLLPKLKLHSNLVCQNSKH